MTRTETRYTGVWDDGYAAGMAEANRTLAEAIEAGVEFAPPGNRWDRNLITARVGSILVDAPKQAIIEALSLLVRRATTKPEPAHEGRFDC